MNNRRYSIGNSTFGLMDYPTKENPWTIQQKLEATARHGYHHFEGDFGDADRVKVRQQAKELGLSLGYLRFGVRSAADMEGVIAEAKEADASYIVVIAGKSFYSVEQSVDLVGSFKAMAASAGLPFYLETHRDSVTQDLLRCTELIRQLPELSLVLDLSHMLVAGEITEDLYEESIVWLEPLFKRAMGLHGRISNGNQIQIGIESLEDHSAAQKFGLLWMHAIRAWKQNSLAAAEPFRFTIELGPPPYALTTRTSNGQVTETVDRVQQGSLLVKLFQQAWEQADHY